MLKREQVASNRGACEMVLPSTVMPGLRRKPTADSVPNKSPKYDYKRLTGYLSPMDVGV